MHTYKNIYNQLYSYDNLFLAFKKASKDKTQKDYVKSFKSNLDHNLQQLQAKLKTHTYHPEELSTFIIRDPKTRKINASDFRDRVVHHALCNILEPILAKRFIYDSFANQIGKGTHKAVKRFEHFQRKVGTEGYVLKADIKHYFDTVNHKILLDIISKKIKDKEVLWLIGIILNNYKAEIDGQGMPIGNLTSQFFANVYLNELDYYIKHQLKIKYYIRYVDDFVVLNKSKAQLENQKALIDIFIKEKLKLELHPDKSRISRLNAGTTFLGYRIFSKYRLLKKSNTRRIWKRIVAFKEIRLPMPKAMIRLSGWLVYANFANTYNFQKRVIKSFYEAYKT